MRRCSAGFTIAEAIVSVMVLTIAVMGTVKTVAASKQAAATSDLATSFSYYEDLLVARGTLVASNLLFWMNNVSNGCDDVGYFLAGQAPPGKAGDDLIRGDFFDPLNFEGHELTPFTSWSLASTNTGIAAIRDWYALADKTEPVAQMVNRCVTEPDLLTPGKNMSGKSTFRFCLSLKSTLTPAARMALQSPLSAGEMTFVVAEFLVRNVDLYSGQDIQCQNKNPAVLEQFAANRSMEITLMIGEVKNYHLPYFQQTRAFITRAYSAPKSQRMLINCHHCINLGDPAFRYECSYMVNVLQCKE